MSVLPRPVAALLTAVLLWAAAALAAGSQAPAGAGTGGLVRSVLGPGGDVLELVRGALVRRELLAAQNEEAAVKAVEQDAAQKAGEGAAIHCGGREPCDDHFEEDGDPYTEAGAEAKNAAQEETRLKTEKKALALEKEHLKAEEEQVKTEEQKVKSEFDLLKATASNEENKLKAEQKNVTDAKTGYKDKVKDAVQEADQLAFSIIGMTVVVMLMFYYVNSEDPDLRGAAWKVASDGTSLFCAVLAFDILRDAMALLPKTGNTTAQVLMGFGRFLCLFAGVEGALVACQNRPFRLAACGLLGAHILGFTAVDAFGLLQECRPFSDSPAFSILAVLVAAIVLVGMCGAALKARQFVKRGNPQWEHQCEHSEDEFMAFTFGLLICQLVSFCILGKLPPLYGSKDKKTWSQISFLLLASVFFAIGVPLAGILRAFMTKRHAGRAIQRALGLFQATLGMSMAWCLLFAAKWVTKTLDKKGIVTLGTNMTNLLWMAFFWTGVGLAVILVVDKVADRVEQHVEGLRSLIDAIILLIGLSWEKTFMEALSVISAGDHHIVVQALERLALLLFVLPAWVMHMVPRVHHGHGGGHGDHGEGHGHGDGHDHGEEHGAEHGEHQGEEHGEEHGHGDGHDHSEEHGAEHGEEHGEEHCEEAHAGVDAAGRRASGHEASL